MPDLDPTTPADGDRGARKHLTMSLPWSFWLRVERLIPTGQSTNSWLMEAIEARCASEEKSDVQR